MGLNLYAHNAKAYKSALAMMQQYGKAAIVHPTGTGKTISPLNSSRTIQKPQFCGSLPASISSKLSLTA